MIFEEYESHPCTPLLNGNTIKAELPYYIIVDNQKDEPTIVAKDMDGTLYMLTLTNKTKEYFSPRIFKHPNLTPNE
jgi:hypothetical protein